MTMNANEYMKEATDQIAHFNVTLKNYTEKLQQPKNKIDLNQGIPKLSAKFQTYLDEKPDFNELIQNIQKQHNLVIEKYKLQQQHENIINMAAIIIANNLKR